MWHTFSKAILKNGYEYRNLPEELKSNITFNKHLLENKPRIVFDLSEEMINSILESESIIGVLPNSELIRKLATDYKILKRLAKSDAWHKVCKNDPLISSICFVNIQNVTLINNVGVDFLLFLLIGNLQCYNYINDHLFFNKRIQLQIYTDVRQHTTNAVFSEFPKSIFENPEFFLQLNTISQFTGAVKFIGDKLFSKMIKYADNKFVFFRNIENSILTFTDIKTHEKIKIKYVDISAKFLQKVLAHVSEFPEHKWISSMYGANVMVTYSHSFQYSVTIANYLNCIEMYLKN